MRYLLFVVFLAVAVIAPAQQYPTAEELIEVLMELEQGIAESNQGLTLLTKGLIELQRGEVTLKKGQDLSVAALDESNAQVKNLQTSFDGYKKETGETIRKLRIGIFAIGAGCIISLFLALIT